MRRGLTSIITVLAALVAVVLPSVAREALAQTPVVIINEFVASNQGGLTDNTGATEDWIELHNTSGSTVDLGGWTISDSTDTFTFAAGTTVGPDSYRVVFASGDVSRTTASELHLPFKLSADGESLVLADSFGTASVPSWPPSGRFPSQIADVSFGVGSGSILAYFTTPTPGAANGDGLTGIVEPVTFSVDHGFYNTAQSVVLNTITAGATIRYTTDGSTPAPSHGTVIAPGLSVAVDSTTTLRAVAYRSGWVSSMVETRTYLFLDDIITQSAAPPPGWPADDAVNSQDMDYEMDPSVVAGNETVIKNSLQSIPSISIVTDLDNLFDATTGIYVNARERGAAWERPASIELIDPSGAEPGFDINGGIRIRGGFSRSPFNPKHSFRLFFGNDYEGVLDYPLFGDEGVTTHEKFDLRTSQNYSWSWRHTDEATFIDEVWSRDSQAAMGRPYSRSRPYHLYLNGVYWGLYLSQERVSADYAERYFGGDDADYDVVKRSAPGTEFEATDGTPDAWEGLWPLVTDGVVDDAEYTQIESQVDLESLVDFYLLHFVSGDFDSAPSWYLRADGEPPWMVSNNWYAVRNRDGVGPAARWQFFDHDSEHSLCAPGNHDQGENFDNTTPWNLRTEQRFMAPAQLHEALITHDAYRQLFADAVQRHVLSPDGALTPAASNARLDARIAEFDGAIEAESARWGDGSGSTDPVHGRAEWNNGIARIRACFADRPAVVQAQLEADGLWPVGEPPTISPASGTIDHGASVTIDAGAQAGAIWYTTDGSDPRGTDGDPSPAASTWGGSLTVTSDMTVRARVLDGTTWTPIAEASYTLAGPTGAVAMALNEYNAVSASSYLGGGGAADTVNGSDATLGRIAGNGGDWFELVVIEDHLDIRGWKLDVWHDSAGVPTRTASLVLAQSPVLADLRAGTIVTVSEAIADDTSYFPPAGDWHINLQADDAGSGAHVTQASQSDFVIDNDNTQIAIFDDAGAPVAALTGEGTVAGVGVSNTEVFKLEAEPDGSLTPAAATYRDGTTSTWGLPNVWSAGTTSQQMAALRLPFGDANCSGGVSVLDALVIAQFSALLRTDNGACPLPNPVTGIYAEAGDVNHDQRTNVLDALLIAQCSARLTNIYCPD